MMHVSRIKSHDQDYVPWIPLRSVPNIISFVLIFRNLDLASSKTKLLIGAYHHLFSFYLYHTESCWTDHTFSLGSTLRYSTLWPTHHYALEADNCSLNVHCWRNEMSLVNSYLHSSESISRYVNLCLC